MDSRIREAYESGYSRGHNDTVESRVVSAEIAAEEYGDALLTAEPEPCEDARDAFEKWAVSRGYSVDGSPIYADRETRQNWYGWEAARQYAAKQTEELRETVETLREALKKIDRIDCEALAESTGLPIDDFTGGYAGSETVSGVAREALAATEPTTVEPALDVANNRRDALIALGRVELPKCDRCDSIACGTGCDGSSHYTPEKKEAESFRCNGCHKTFTLEKPHKVILVTGIMDEGPYCGECAEILQSNEDRIL